MTDGRHYHKVIMYTYGAAKLSRLSDHLSQPGNIRHVSGVLCEIVLPGLDIIN
jgi:hypothetical protein